MKKTVVTGLITFVLGMGLTAMVLTNPFRWEWMHLFGHAVMDPVDAGTGQLWTCGMHPQVLEDGPGTCPICGMNLVPVRGTEPASADLPDGERKIKYWQAPMDPTYIRDEPGKSPMGMDLVPVYEDADEDFGPGAIRIDPVFVQNIGVQSELVQRTDIPFTIRTVGTLAYDDKQIAWVNTKYEGWIENVYINYVGEPVEKGQKLFEIYSPQLVTTQKEYLQALDYADKMEDSDYPEIAKRAKSLLGSSRERLSYWDVSEEQIRALETTRELRRTLAVVAPVGGVVVEKMDQALDGMFVKAGMNLYKIVDLSSIFLEATVYEHQVPWLRVGTRARIDFPYEPGKTLTGRIRYLYPFFRRRHPDDESLGGATQPGRTPARGYVRQRDLRRALGQGCARRTRRGGHP